MVDTSDTWNITGGMDVVGVDGEKVGQVTDVPGDYMVVSKGLLFPTRYFIPTSAIASVSDKVYLNLTRDEALAQGEGSDPDAGATDIQGNDIPSDAGIERTADRDVVDDDTMHVELAEEELSAHTRDVERGRVHVDKVVTKERQTLDVPVTEEWVAVNRQPVDREVPPGEATFTEETIDVPVRGEEVVVDKRVHIREEIEISKEAVTETRHVTDTVRREEARIRDEQGNVIEDGDSRDTR
jgi:uncharacterized protein (TIGR02271 family)